MIMLRYSVFLISFLFVLGRASAQEKFWGMTPTGGISGTGVIFNINSDGTGFIKSHDFFSPFAGLSPYYTNLIEVSPGVLAEPMVAGLFLNIIMSRVNIQRNMTLMSSKGHYHMAASCWRQMESCTG